MVTPVEIALGYHAGQEEVSRDPARFKVLAAGRRWGKTRLGISESLHVASKGGRAWWVAPTYPIAMEGWRPLRAMGHEIPGAQVREADRELRLPGGGVIEVRSADNPQRLRGAGLDLVVLDEAAFMAAETWTEALRPSLSDRQGSALFISTPMGHNWFWDLYERARVLDGWSQWRFPTSSNPRIDPAELDQARTELGTLVFSQEFDAEFVDMGGQVFHRDWMRYCTIRAEKSEAATVELESETVDVQDLRRFVTVDLAASTKEHADYTAIAVTGFDGTNLIVLDVLRRRLEGPDILPAVRRLQQLWDVPVVHIERTGFQLALIQQARRDGMAVKELRADRDKISRSLPLQARMEAGNVWFPRDAPWMGELQRELLAFPNAAHDDQVDALAYAAVLVGQPNREWRFG
jgi:predicted phage terminase large subunit-like protein